MSRGGSSQPGGGCPGRQTEIEMRSSAMGSASRAAPPRRAQRFSGGDRPISGRPRSQRSHGRRSASLSGSRRCPMPIASFCMRWNQYPDRVRRLSTLIAEVSISSTLWIVPGSPASGGPEWRCDGLLGLSPWVAAFGTTLLRFQPLSRGIDCRLATTRSGRRWLYGPRAGLLRSIRARIDNADNKNGESRQCENRRSA